MPPQEHHHHHTCDLEKGNLQMRKTPSYLICCRTTLHLHYGVLPEPPHWGESRWTKDIFKWAITSYYMYCVSRHSRRQVELELSTWISARQVEWGGDQLNVKVMTNSDCLAGFNPLHLNKAQLRFFGQKPEPENLRAIRPFLSSCLAFGLVWVWVGSRVH